MPVYAYVNNFCDIIKTKMHINLRTCNRKLYPVSGGTINKVGQDTIKSKILAMPMPKCIANWKCRSKDKNKWNSQN